VPIDTSLQALAPLLSGEVRVEQACEHHPSHHSGAFTPRYA
jgi:hypothetical protein